MAVRISAVAYLNSKPFVHGLQQASNLQDMELTLDIPSECARKLAANEVDIGLIPVAVIPQLKEYHVVSDFCIGAKGNVASVMLYSQVPLQDIQKILLDYQSRTSVNLVQVLAREFWKIDPEFVSAAPGFEQQVNGTTAAVVIGDRTFRLNGTFPYEYDLAGEWFRFTGLPFVFACWVSNKPIDPDFLVRFNGALEKGLEQLDLLSDQLQQNGNFPVDVRTYLTQNISFEYDTSKQEALSLFLNKLPSP